MYNKCLRVMGTVQLLGLSDDIGSRPAKNISVIPQNFLLLLNDPSFPSPEARENH